MSPEPTMLSSPALELTRHELPNGLVVFHQRAPPNSVTFAVSWVGEGGSARDPSGKEGTATALSRLLNAGTRTRSKRDFAREIDRLAATFAARASWEKLEIEASGPQDAQEAVLSLVYDALTQPRLDPTELRRIRRELREALLREMSQPDERADRVFLEKLLPASHPYRRNPLGSPEALARLTREGLLDFHRAHLTPRGAKLIVTTHEPPATLLRKLRGTFGALDGGPALPPPEVPLSRPAHRAPLLYVSVPGTSQVEVVVGGTAPVRGHPDFPALTLANEILGGRSVLSRLFQIVREREGLAYGASSELESLAWAGLWTADAGTDPKHVETVHRLLTGEVRRLSEEGPSPAELRRIRESFLGSLPLLLETSTQAHGLAVEVGYFDLPLDHFQQWPRVLRALRPADVRRAAREHLWNGGAPLAVAVGPPRQDRPKDGKRP
ncbi:MAG: insulinase family protein [Euryarchaeota archaeon]|nr:insulinase family protein [Euryarchaeota archaeon]MDE1835911.1 insulinase family protein [Euryarchaeota archaeon]MDE1880214.1 insulinase family protein [Euryarchaeota archaeon]MDE2044411.1 insulinase family protein [Thermoplasmata archaeon]